MRVDRQTMEEMFPLTGSTLESLDSQRVGRKESASDPQIVEFTCMEVLLMNTLVSAGT